MWTLDAAHPTENAYKLDGRACRMYVVYVFMFEENTKNARNSRTNAHIYTRTKSKENGFGFGFLFIFFFLLSILFDMRCHVYNGANP